MRTFAPTSFLRCSSLATRMACLMGLFSMLTVVVLRADVAVTSGTVSLPLTTGESGKIALGQFTGGTLVRITVAGTGDLVNSTFQVNPDGSVIGTVGSPWGAANPGATYPSVSGFPAGDGINRFPGGGFNYDFGGGSGWMFAGKQTTDTRDPAAIRAGAVVGTFVASPTRSDWFLIGYGGWFTVPAGGATLYVAVNESNSTDNHGTYTVNFASVVAADAFASRSTLGGTSFSLTASNVGATKETGEPATHAGNAGGASVWWAWTAPKTGIVTLNTVGSSFDTLLAVYSGSAVNALTALASDDNSGPANTSRLSFAAIAGTTYQIVVDGFGGATGTVVLNLALNSAVSSFAADLESWGVVSFANLSANSFEIFGTYSATYNATGGNSGGYASSADPDGGDFTFSAPAAFLGNRLGSYGSTLSYDLIHPVGTVDYQGLDVVLVGNGTRLVWQRDPAIVPAAASWTTVKVPLAPTPQWRVGTSTGALATSADFLNVLGALTGMYIRGEFTLGPDLTGIDNVSLGLAPQGAPFINVLTPSALSAGSTVALTGANFTGATAVSFNGAAATSFTVVSDTSITAVVPSGVTAGVVTVTGPGGTSTTPVTYTVGALPVVTSVSPRLTIPGASVTITGTNLTGATSVTFNGTAATNVTVVSATQITAIVPAGATSGPVLVTTPGGTSATGSNAVIPKNHYAFNNGGVTDSMGSANGTLVNGATLSGGRLVLDGVDDYVQFGAQLVPTSGPFTVALFAQQTSAQGGFRELISQGQTGAPGFYIGHDGSRIIRLGDSWSSTGVAFPSDGLLHHYAATTDATNTKLYVDGVLVATSNSPIGMTTGGDNTRLGAQFQAFGEFFQGSIDELWIFSSALAPTDIAALAASVPQTITVKSDASTLAAATTNLSMLDNGGTAGLTFSAAAVGSFGTGSPVPPGAPSGTLVINIPPGDGSSGYFKTTFTLPANFTFPQITGAANADDVGRVFLNGNPLTPSMFSGSSGIVSHSGNATFASTNAAYFVPGVNVLLVADNNSGGGPSGGSFFANISFQSAAPVLTVQPQNQAVSIGASAAFAVGANGSTGLSYQWQRQAAGATGFSNLNNGGAYAGATSATLTVSGATALMNGDQFRCVVGDGVGPATTSTAAQLSVVSGSGIVSISIPTNSHDATSRATLDGVWSVAVPPFPLSQSGIGVIVKPTWNTSVTSADWALHDHVYLSPNVPDPARAVVTMAFSAPTVVTQLEVVQHTNGVSRIECFVGDSLNALVSIGNVFGPSGDVVGGSLYTEGAAQVFQFTNTTAARYCRIIIRKTTLDNGWALYRIFPRDASGQRILGVAAVATQAPVVGAVAPTTFGVGSTVTVTGSGFTGATAVNFNGVPATSFSVVNDTTITAVVPTGATNGVLSVTTPAGTTVGTTPYTISAPPVIVASPAHTTVIPGGQLKLSVQVSGSAPFSYVWRFTPAAGGATVDVTGATGPTLTIGNFDSSKVGAYQAFVSNAYGSNVPSAVANVVAASAASAWRADASFARPQFRQTVAPSRVTLAPNGNQFYVTWNNGDQITGAGNQRIGPILRFNNDATGTLDSSFVSAASGLSDALAIAFQANGQLLVGGVDSAEENDSGSRVFRVFRLNLDGTRDFAYRSPAFGALPRFMTVQSDGKLLVACGPGSTRLTGINTLARLNSDGSLDTTFASPAFDNNGGGVFAPPVIDSAGRILIGGNFSAVNGTSRPGLARLDSAGALDTTFVPAMAFIGGGGQVRGLAIQTLGSNAGKILVAGGPFSVSGSDCVVARLDPASGAVDASFTRPSASAAGMSPRPRLLALDAATDGFTLVGATVARFTADGVAATGFTRPTVVAPQFLEFFWMAVTADGKVLVPVSEFAATINGSPVSGVARLTATGALDTGFAPPVMQREVLGDGLFVQSDSRALFLGEFNIVNSAARAGLARFNLNGSPDALTLSGLSNLLWVSGGVVRSDGSFLVEAVTKTATGGSERSIRLFNAAGALDTSVTLEAGVASALTNERDWSEAEPLADDRMLVGVNSPQRVVNGSVYFVRVNANGTLDTSFTGLGVTNFGAVYRTPAANVISQVVVGEFKLLTHYADGSALAAVSTGPYPQNATSLAVKVVRLTPSGTIDSTFSGPTVSMATTSYFASSSSAPLTDTVATPPTSYTVVRPDHPAFQGAVILSDNRVLIGGDFSTLGDHATVQLARLNATGGVDTSFSTGTGPAFRYRQGRNARISNVAVAPDGKYWVTGAFDTFNGFAAPGIVRLNANGSVDTTFATDIGYRSYLIESDSKVVFANDGSVYLAGSYALPADLMPYALTRLTVPVVPEITAQLNATSSVIAGGTVTLSVTATGTPAPSYYWQLNGTTIPDATGPSLTITNATQANAGTYTVFVSHPTLNTPLTSSTVLSVIGRDLMNLLARVSVPARASVGGSFTIEGGAKTMLIRAVGPSLDGTGNLADPRLTLLNAAFVTINSNDDWGQNANASAITSATSALGLSPGLTVGSKDAALLVTLNPGTYTVVLDGVGGTGGAVQLDIVDADTGLWPRLALLTMRGFSTWDSNLNVGFNLGGTAERKFLIRALGPTLGYNAAANNGVLVDPYMYVYRGATQLVSNDDTYEDSTMLAAITQVGAMPRFGRNNNYSYYDNYDSTVLLNLQPGAHTVRVRPYASSEAGEVLLEIHAVDDLRPATIAPAITYLSPNQNALSLGDFALGVVVVAKPAPTFQWRRYINGTPTPITGATANILRQSNLQLSDSGSSYDVVITSGTNTITSPPRTVTILPNFHSADTNRDGRISLSEVTRVIQLHNYTANGTRTGEYHTQSDTEDGFAPGPGVRTSFHAADTDRDGRISGTELARVIELYSYVNGTVRTGEYHPQVGTEDNFAPGPATGSLGGAN